MSHFLINDDLMKVNEGKSFDEFIKKARCCHGTNEYGDKNLMSTIQSEL